jgi:hypothetical protein
MKLVDWADELLGAAGEIRLQKQAAGEEASASGMAVSTETCKIAENEVKQSQQINTIKSQQK